ncbi:MAG: hypothetical protein IJ264_08040 [Clostridia bacterium]|nr:hypothetical protein [Clostridia bacterium]
MENKDLFQKVSEGYNCEQVEQYINVLKTEYKKVFEYAKATEANNEKLKKICRSLSDENKALKATGAVAAAPAAPAPSADAALAESVNRLAQLTASLAKEAETIKSIIAK